MFIRDYPINVTVESLEYYVSEDKVNICNFIRSKEIRDYFNQIKYFDNCNIMDKFEIIIRSLIPIDIKIIAIRKLLETENGSDEDINNIKHYIDKSTELLDIIYNNEDIIFSINECKYKVVDNSIEREWTDNYYSYSFDEIIEMYNGCWEDCWELGLGYNRIYLLDVIFPKKYNNDNPDKIFALLTFFNGKLKIYTIKDWTEDKYLFLHSRYPLPFEKDIVLYNAFLDKPLYGIIENELDGNNCWYHFCYFGDKCIDVSNNSMNYGMYGLISVFDSLYSKEYFEKYIINKDGEIHEEFEEENNEDI